MASDSKSNKAILLAVPLGFAVYSYSKNYSLGKGVLVTVLGSLAVGVALGVAEVVYGVYQISNKDFIK